MIYKKNSQYKIMEDEIYPGDIDASKLPIEFNRYIDKFVLEAPNGDTYYFRDYEGAEDFLFLNFKDHIEDLALS